MDICLRALELDDYKKIVIWRNNPEVTDLLGGNRFYVSSHREKEWVEDAIRNDRKNLHLVICDTDKEAIGLVNLTNIDLQNRKAEFSIMIGDKKSQGKGVGEKSTLLMLKHAFEFLNLNKVWLTVLTNNTIAIKLYEKIGFKNEGILRQEVYKNNSYQDMLVMSILKEEYVK